MNTGKSSIEARSASHPAAVLAVLVIALSGAFLSPGDSIGAEYVYGAVLTGRQEVPPNASTAMGGGQFLIDTDANTVTYRIAFAGLSGAETAAHIHGVADPGMNAGVLQGLAIGNPKVGVWNYLEANEADILAGKTYVNIHTTAFGGGEIRGQIVALNASLDGAQEVPPVATPASGWGVFTIDTVMNQLSYHIAFAGLAGAETAAHIHGAVLHGTNAPVVQALPLGSPKVGVWNYAEAQEEAILAGRTYVNVHSMAFPGGEIRGQIVPIVAPMDGNQEVPPNGSPAAGIALISHDVGTDNLSYDIRGMGLSSAETAAHIHGFAPAGMNAGVLAALPLGNRKLGVWNFGAANEDDVFAGLTYVNIHSVNFPGGEIRGQLRGFVNPAVAGIAERGIAPAVVRASSYPNPFRDAVTIELASETMTPVRVWVYDVLGRHLRTLAGDDLAASRGSVVWDGRDMSGRQVATGVYHYILRSGDEEAVGHLTRLR